MSAEWIVAILALITSLVFVFCFLRWIRRTIREENESRRGRSILDVEPIQADFRAIAAEVKAEILAEVTKQSTLVANLVATKAAEEAATKAVEEVLRKHANGDDSWR